MRNLCNVCKFHHDLLDIIMIFIALYNYLFYIIEYFLIKIITWNSSIIGIKYSSIYFHSFNHHLHVNINDLSLLLTLY